MLKSITNGMTLSFYKTLPSFSSSSSSISSITLPSMDCDEVFQLKKYKKSLETDFTYDNIYSNYFYIKNKNELKPLLGSSVYFLFNKIHFVDDDYDDDDDLK
jgi:hypothetical protein